MYDGTHQTPKYTKSGVQFVSVEDIKTLDKATKYISKEAFKKEFKIFPEYGDVLMTRIGDIGTPAIVYNNYELAYYVSLALLKPRTVVSSFLKFAIESNSFQKELWKRSIHVAFPKKINKEEIGECNLLIPLTEEQKQVADFLSTIDKRIDTQSKIIKDLELYKKKISDMFFNSMPEHEIKLSEIFLKGKAGGTPSSTNREYYNGGIPFLSIADMTEQGKYVYKTEKELSEKGLKNSSAWLVPENCLIISMYASVGFVSINKIPLTTSQAMFSMVIKDDFLLEYIYYYLNYFKHNKIHRLLETGTQSNINADMVKNIKIPFYGELKNNQIVNTLTVIDRKIQKEKDMLELYKKQKAYLLQNMFI